MRKGKGKGKVFTKGPQEGTGRYTPPMVNVEPGMGTHPSRFPSAPRVSTGMMRNKITKGIGK